MSFPKTLYHAAGFKFDELKPGFLRSGKVVEWDFGESNKFLYAVDDANDAEMLGFGSAIEKKILMDRFVTRGNDIKIHLSKDQPIPSHEEIRDIELFVYTIQVAPEHLWMKNNNEHNGLSNEYKTTATIGSRYLKCRMIDMNVWLKDKHLTFEKA